MVQAHSDYPGGYHVVNFLGAALQEAGAHIQYDSDALQGCEGLVVNGRPVVWFLDNRIPGNRQWQDPIARNLLATGDAMVLHCQLSDRDRVGGKWLPIATTPRFSAPPHPLEKTHDIAFVGFLKDAQRKAVVQNLTRHYHAHVTSHQFYEDAAAVYHHAKIGVNVPALYGTGYDTDVNMREFEIMASGTPLVTNDNLALNRLGIKDSVNCLTYRNERELHRAIDLLLGDAALRNEISKNAVALIERRHRYRHRAETLLDLLNQ